MAIQFQKRPDTVGVTDQYVFGYRGSTDQTSFRWKGSETLWRYTVVAGGVSKYADETVDAVAGTTYHFAGTWTKADATGMKLYKNGALISTVNTTTQTANCAPGAATDLYLAAFSAANSPGICTLENVMFAPGVVWTADQIARLYYSGWWHLANVAKPAAIYELSGAKLTQLDDISGNKRHITSGWITGTLSAATQIGKREAPYRPQEFYMAGAAGTGPPTPNPWTLFGSSTHPTVTKAVTGLVNGTAYEFCVSAVDSSANEGVKSDTAEGTPNGVTITHVPRRVFLGH